MAKNYESHQEEPFLISRSKVDLFLNSELQCIHIYIADDPL